jgi:4,5-DOPA dioxygenase extradiol
MLPVLFIAHGSPMMAIEEHDYTRMLGALGRQVKPKAVVLFSAHWESPTQTVSTAERYDTIYDFGGFPEELYRIKYPAPGDAQLAAEIGARFVREGIPYRTDSVRGLDHGAWVVLRLLYPNADVPVVSLSVNPDIAPQEQYRIGKALADLRAEDVLIIASGVTVHNFSTLRWRDTSGKADSWAVEFDDWVLDKAARWDLESLFAYESLAPHARLAVPPQGREHFVPLFYALGAADDQRTAKELFRTYQMGNLSYVVWQFGE